MSCNAGQHRVKNSPAHIAPVGNRWLAGCRCRGKHLHGGNLLVDEFLAVNEVKAVHVSEPAELIEREIAYPFYGEALAMRPRPGLFLDQSEFPFIGCELVEIQGRVLRRSGRRRPNQSNLLPWPCVTPMLL